MRGGDCSGQPCCLGQSRISLSSQVHRTSKLEGMPAADAFAANLIRGTALPLVQRGVGRPSQTHRPAGSCFFTAAPASCRQGGTGIGPRAAPRAAEGHLETV